MDYFRATCEYFERAPESQFTGSSTVSVDSTRHRIDPAEWHDLLTEEFGVTSPPVTSSESTDPHSSAQSKPGPLDQFHDVSRRTSVSNRSARQYREITTVGTSRGTETAQKNTEREAATRAVRV
jgi:hypothetical protein